MLQPDLSSGPDISTIKKFDYAIKNKLVTVNQSIISSCKVDDAMVPEKIFEGFSFGDHLDHVIKIIPRKILFSPPR